MPVKNAVAAVLAVAALGGPAHAAPAILVEPTFTRAFGTIANVSAPALQDTPEATIISSGTFEVQGTVGSISATANPETGEIDWKMSGPSPAVTYTPTDRKISALLSRDPLAGSMSTTSGPSVLVAEGEEAQFEISDGPLHYFEREGDSWKLKESNDMHLSLSTQAHVADNGKIVFDRLAIEMTFLAGREPIPGTSLDAGKPILSTHSVNTRFEADSGTVYWLWPKLQDKRGALLVGIRATVVDDNRK